jgi:uncharacterized surface protein with fasciclin (FAS1) repeats
MPKLLSALLVAGVAGLAATATGSAASARPAAAEEKNIVETAVAAGSFTTLVALVEQAGLVDALSGDDKLTVFAPTDEAFAKLPQATLDDLLKPENKAKLRRILTYHVVPGRVTAAEAMKLTTAKAVSGDTIDIKATGGSVMVDNARVMKTDINASNGVIHVIDSVILPDGAE